MVKKTVMEHQKEISKQLDLAAESIKLNATEKELAFMKNIGVGGTFRSFVDVKTANFLHKRGWIENQIDETI